MLRAEEDGAMRPGTDDGLRLILEGTLAETGRGFFRALVRNLCRALGTTGAWVTECVPDRARLRSLAFWWKDGHVESHEYDLAGTPCGQVIAQKRLVHCPESVVDLFPEDPNLDRFGAVGFLGVPLFRSREEVLGHLAVLDTKPLPPNRRMATLLEIFAARAAAEYRGLEFEDRLRGRERLLARIIETSTDGILVFDEARTIVRSNPEADRLFLGRGMPRELEPGSDADLGLLRASPAPSPATSPASSGLVGRGLASLFDEVSRGELERAIRGLLQTGEFRLGQRYSMDLVAARIDGSTFPVELALSAFEDGRGRFLTAILRNAREGLRAERNLRVPSDEAERLRDAARAAEGTGPILGSSPPPRIFTAQEMEARDRENTLRALGASGWKIAGERGAAALLGLPPSTLTSRMKALGIKRASRRP